MKLSRKQRRKKHEDRSRGREIGRNSLYRWGTRMAMTMAAGFPSVPHSVDAGVVNYPQVIYYANDGGAV